MRTLRNLALAGLLWAAGSVAAPAEVSAAWCDPIWMQLDRTNLQGYCAPGGVDACGYYRSECDYYCFSMYSGHLCWNALPLCSQYNAGTEWDPMYCLSSGFCDCFYEP